MLKLWNRLLDKEHLVHIEAAKEVFKFRKDEIWKSDFEHFPKLKVCMKHNIFNSKNMHVIEHMNTSKMFFV